MSMDHPGLPAIEATRFATGADLMVFVNQLALQDRPARYWIVAWITSSSNMLVGLTVVTAGLMFRYKKFDEKFWIIRFQRRSAKRSVPETEAKSYVTGRKYVTASTFNSHLLFTSAYAMILFSSIVQAWSTRDYTSLPVINPVMLDCAMMLALWTKACLGCIGYIELLLPNVNAVLWNMSFGGIWFSTVLIGLWVSVKTTLYNSKVVSIRPLIYAQVLEDGLHEQPSEYSILLARYAWSHAITQGKWLQMWKGLCGLGAVMQAVVYLSIFTFISQKVGRELWQIRARAKYVDANFDTAERGREFEATWWRAQEDRDPSSAPVLTSPDCYRPLGLFLLHCLLDHINITLQSIGIGATSLYMAVRVNHDMRTDPAAANKADYMMSMYACGIFAILYPLNAMNMVFPFIWYPPSKLALLTQQVLRDRKMRADHALRNQEQPLRTQISLQSLLRRGDNNDCCSEAKAVDVGAELDDKAQVPLDEPGSPQGGLRHRSSARQLILDSLVMSHSLPIQGFYCRPPLKSPTAADEPAADELEMISSPAAPLSHFSAQRRRNFSNDSAQCCPPPHRPPRSLLRSTSLTVLVHKEDSASSVSSFTPSPWPASPYIAFPHTPSASQT